MKPAQVRMARAALNWSLSDLAGKAKVHRNTVSNFETGRYGGTAEATAAMRAALEAAGVLFVEENGEGPGVRMRKTKILMTQHTFLNGARTYEHSQAAATKAGLVFVYSDNDGVDLMLDGARIGSARWAAGGVYFEPPVNAEGMQTESIKVFDEWVTQSCRRHRDGD